MKRMSVKRLSQGDHFLNGQWIMSRKAIPTKLSYITPRQESFCLCPVMMVPPICYYYNLMLSLVSGWVGILLSQCLCFASPSWVWATWEKEIRSYFLLPFQHLAHHFTHSRYSVKAWEHWRFWNFFSQDLSTWGNNLPIWHDICQ